MPTKGFISHRHPANSRAIPGAVFHHLARGKDTGGAYALMEVFILPGNEPPLHIHQKEDESTFILNGEVRYTIGDQVLVAKPGDHVFLPKDVPHRFEVLSPAAHFLLWVTPAGFDRWFWENSVPAPDMEPLPLRQGPPSPEEARHFVSSLVEYGGVILGAPVLQD